MLRGVLGVPIGQHAARSWKQHHLLGIPASDARRSFEAGPTTLLEGDESALKRPANLKATSRRPGAALLSSQQCRPKAEALRVPLDHKQRNEKSGARKLPNTTVNLQGGLARAWPASPPESIRGTLWPGP